MRVYVLWRHQHGEFELLGVFTMPERFQEFVVQKFSRLMVAARWRRGNGEWYFTVPEWEFVASPLEVARPPE